MKFFSEPQFLGRQSVEFRLENLYDPELFENDLRPSMYACMYTCIQACILSFQHNFTLLASSHYLIFHLSGTFEWLSMCTNRVRTKM